MNLLMVTPRFPPFTGGVELHVAEVSRRLVGQGHRVTVLTTDTTGELPAEETWEGVELRRVRAWPRDRDYYLAPGVYRRVAYGGFDVVHVQSYHTLVAPLAMAAARSTGVPFVLTFHAGGHSSRVRNAARGLQLALLRPLIADAARLVALAEFEIDLYSSRLRLPREQFVLIPNGADLPTPGERPAGSAAAPLIASIGRLERYKGHQHVIAALPAILREQSQARLWIAGSGPYQPRLEALIRHLGVVDRTEIRAVPVTDRQRMVDELARVAVVVLASDFETHPIAVLEAAALGCGIVVADAPGLRELGQRGLARVVTQPRDPEQLARAILEELAAPRVPRSLELPSWEECAGRLGELYAEVVATPGRRLASQAARAPSHGVARR